MSAVGLRHLRAALRSWGAAYVVVTNRGGLPADAAAVFTAATGRPPVVQDRAWVWDLRARPLALPYHAEAAAQRLAFCTGSAVSLGPVRAGAPLPQALNRCVAGRS